jgi:MFS superfamily sulfate permease-like transporter
LPDTHLPSLTIGGAALAVLLLGKFFLKNRPVALVVVIAGIVVASTTELADRGVKMLGNVPQGLPALGLPAITLADLNELLPLAMACFLLAAVETAAIGRMFAVKHRYRFDPNEEFLSLAASNMAAGLGSGFPVSGGMSQSLVNESGGARTAVSTLVASLLILVVVLWFSGLLHNLPQPVLAAIVLTAVIGLVNVKAIRRLWRFSRTEFAISAVALLGVLGSGILRGVLIGAILSLVLLLRRASRPHTTELARVPGTEFFADLARNPSYERIPDVLVFRVRGALLYFNIDYVFDRFMESLNQRGEGVKLVVFYLGTVPAIDLAGAEFITELHHTLHARGIDLRLAEAHTEVCRALSRSDFAASGVPIEVNQGVLAVVTDWNSRQQTANRA